MNNFLFLFGIFKRITAAVLLFCMVFCTVANAQADEESVNIPQFINPNVITTLGTTPTIRTIRFLTTDDFPPFNFIDQQGRLEGFNVSLARALCFEIKARCTMQALPWDNLSDALSKGQGDAIIAGLAVSDATIREHAFSVPYLRMPARFFANKNVEIPDNPFKGPGTQTVGVEAGTSHEAFLKKLFPETPIKAFKNQEELRNALRDKVVSLGFGDGVSLSFWLQSSDAKDCCSFIGGPYLSSDFFGQGLSIAVPIDRLDLKQVLDDGLGKLMRKSRYAEIYLQFFPISFF
ncbi:MAG: transporter substrate-binding domain-containing protein [Hyphomicrobiales bacterium]